MERTDWLDVGFDSAQAQFLMVTAITHHRFSSALWGEDEVRKLHAELAEIASAGVGDDGAGATRATPPPPPPYLYGDPRSMKGPAGGNGIPARVVGHA